MQLSRIFVGILAAVGISMNSYSVNAQSVDVDNVTEDSQIVLRQNDIIQHSFDIHDGSDVEALSHYSHASHSSHYSHASHSSHYSYYS